MSNSKIRILLPLLAVVLLVLAAAPTFAGTCFGGPRNGATCFSSSDCGTACAGGPRSGTSCVSASSCGMACAGGPRNGISCISFSDCGMTCSGGSRNGASCISSRVARVVYAGVMPARASLAKASRAWGPSPP